jgi:acyl dehydratase
VRLLIVAAGTPRPLSAAGLALQRVKDPHGYCVSCRMLNRAASVNVAAASDDHKGVTMSATAARAAPTPLASGLQALAVFVAVAPNASARGSSIP